MAANTSLASMPSVAHAHITAGSATATPAPSVHAAEIAGAATARGNEDTVLAAPDLAASTTTPSATVKISGRELPAALCGIHIQLLPFDYRDVTAGVTSPTARHIVSIHTAAAATTAPQ
ncbi:hypothetical protein AB8O64_35905 (plasmid) [Streptomyces sp. QH1-20]|uniref:hypothetical protein n=1 Tax=Streptomyces sp. QH1-20 TaxID=3240934 RepID=UPI00351236A7